jgi:putative hydrolase of the HAD superfamily
VNVPRPDVVFFDLGDTLIRTHPSWAGVYRLGLAEHGIEVDEDELARALLSAPADHWLAEGPFEATEEASFARVREYDQLVLESLGYRDLPEQVFRSIEAAFLRRTSWFVFPDTLPAMRALREAGLRLGVISNWVWGGPELIHSVELASHFEALVVSARVGYQKPSARIFEIALEQMGTTAERAIHVGDNYRADVEGARRVGITPVLITRPLEDRPHTPPAPEDPALLVVRDLFELLDLLGVERPAAVSAS